MTLDDAGLPGRRVAAGHTREAAAAAVGPAADDLYITSHADLAREIDLDGVSTLDLVADEGYEPVLLDACRRLREHGVPALRVAVFPGSAGALAPHLDSGGVTITGAETTEGSVVLTLAARGEDGPAHDQVVLSAIDAAAIATPAIAEPGATVGEADRVTAPPSASAARMGPRPEPRLLGRLAQAQRWVTGRRRRPLVLGVLALVFVALLLIGLVPDSLRPLLSIALPLLVVLVLTGAAVTVYTLLLLARQVHVQTGRIERLLLRNREVVHERSTALSTRLQTLEESQSRLPFLEQYVEALAETSAATSTRLRDLLERLEADDDRHSKA